MYTDAKASAYGSTFMVSPPNSLFGKVYSKNMDESSFTGWDYKNGLKMMLSNPKTAFFGSVGSAYLQDAYKSCQVLCDKVIKKINVIFLKA